jgi:hypothetical protein
MESWKLSPTKYYAVRMTVTDLVRSHCQHTRTLLECRPDLAESTFQAQACYAWLFGAWISRSGLRNRQLISKEHQRWVRFEVMGHIRVLARPHNAVGALPVLLWLLDRIYAGESLHRRQMKNLLTSIFSNRLL